jgi:hypothetical protein
MRKWTKLLSLAAVAGCALVAALAPSAALSYQYEHVYCNQSLAVNAACAPNGSSEWAHMELNSANAGGESHATCVDDWYDSEKRFTVAHCMYYASEGAAIQVSSGQYGYPRAWNGGSITHFAYAAEYGYHTSAAQTLAPLSTSVGTPLLGEALSAIPGLDSSAATPVSGTYPVLVVPGEGSTCLLNGPIGMSVAAAAAAGRLGGVCGPTHVAQEKGLIETTESTSGAQVVIGLAPSGNTAVKVTDVGGGGRQVPVVSRVYEVTDGAPSAVTLTDLSGKLITRHVAGLSKPAASAPAGSPTA